LNKGINLIIWLVFLFLILPLGLQLFETPQTNKTVKLGYSQFLDAVRHGDVKKVKIIGQEHIKGELIKNKSSILFTTYIPYEDKDLIPLLEEYSVEFDGDLPTESKWWMGLLWYIGSPVLFCFLLWFLFYRQTRMPGGRSLTNFGQSRARFNIPKDKDKDKEKEPRTTFDDVAGVDEAKQELSEIIEFLKEPKKFQKLGAKIPKGVLLVGPPGTGKTLLARAVAGEADASFLSISGSDFVEMFVGVGASRVRDLFEQARKHSASSNKGCIIFIDEIDAVGRQRGAGLGGGHDEREQTLNQLLVEMDGFDASEGVILIAASNRPDVLDPALLRPGRFDRHIIVDAPDLIGREAILVVHLKGKPVADDVDVKLIARRSPGFVGADIANMANEAALLAARKDKETIEMEDFENAMDRVIAGPERKSRILSEKEKQIVAYHESGHALVSEMIPDSDPIHKISILPRGMSALGYTLQIPLEDRYLTTKSEILHKMAVLLGGRVAEMLIFNEASTGAQNDIERATEAAHKMVCEYGMSDELGPLTYGRKDREVFLGRDLFKEKNYGELVASKIDAETKKIVDSCYQTAREILETNKDKLDKLAYALMEKEVLEADEVRNILGTKEKVIATNQDAGAINVKEAEP
jgi:cell division protease FtsH